MTCLSLLVGRWRSRYWNSNLSDLEALAFFLKLPFCEVTGTVLRTLYTLPHIKSAGGGCRASYHPSERVRVCTSRSLNSQNSEEAPLPPGSACQGTGNSWNSTSRPVLFSATTPPPTATKQMPVKPTLSLRHTNQTPDFGWPKFPENWWRWMHLTLSKPICASPWKARRSQI